jgi:hypothetical protein
MSDPSEPSQGSLPAELKNEIASALSEVGVPEDARSKILAVVQTSISQHNYHFSDGPWIPAEAVKEIEVLCPGFTLKYSELMLERGRLFLAGAEHRIQWEKSEQTENHALFRRGMNFGFLISLALIVGAVYCAYVGATAIGIALVGASALGMVGKFIDGRRNK